MNRYTDVVNRAERWFNGKQRLIWKLGTSEESCQTCKELDGIIAFAREWDQVRIYPQAVPNGLLSCGGWNCHCTCEKTDRRRTPKAIDKLISIAMRRDGSHHLVG